MKYRRFIHTWCPPAALISMVASAGCSAAVVDPGAQEPAETTAEALTIRRAGVTIHQPTNNEQVALGTTFVVSGSASGTGGSEPHSVDSVTVQVDGQTPQDADLQRVGGGVVAYSLSVPTPTPPGPHTIRVVAILDDGATMRASVSVVSVCGAGTLWCQDTCVAPASANACAKTVFVSDWAGQGNFGGILVADLICQNEAQFGGLTGSYRAWISDSQVSAATSLSHGQDAYYRRTDGALVAKSWNGLTSGTLLNPISCDNWGHCGLSYMAWTNTMEDGAAVWTWPPVLFGNCSNWTQATSTDFGPAGTSSMTTVGWSQTPGVQGNPLCSGVAHLYCIEQ